MMELSSQTTATVATALMAAQMDLQQVSLHADMTNNYLGNRYISLSTLLKAVLPVLNKHSLLLVQRVVPTDDHTSICVESRITHTSGEFVSTYITIPLETRNNKISLAQNYGSCLTYARRYGITSLLAICIDTDDDANAGAPMFNSTRTQPMSDELVTIPPDTTGSLPTLPGVSFRDTQLEDGTKLICALGSKVYQYRDELKRAGFMFHHDKKIWARATN